MRFTLEIGGYRLAVHEPIGHPCLVWPLRPFEAFLVDEHQSADVAVDVAIVPILPDLPMDRLRFDSNHGHWKLFESPDGLVLDSTSPKTLTSRARARISIRFNALHTGESLAARVAEIAGRHGGRRIDAGESLRE